ncbi:hypothetical protein CDQ92_10515 [Sphingopyxis bauzanensis]|uniref:Uncharacterized protein n=1 Tax=Sphingopyxis bauzanensis TaxID=651663 RepID=A0A246JWL1_9SPHN|nr:hypothetical protein [Sphingopyxis bauzanensis]OWQ97445.1 hypothetical protein CDQ92_10515 [Sphingopyxis bauzanensis]
MLAKAFKMPARLKKRLRVPAELSHWPSWDAALLETIVALHDDPYLAAGLALPLGQRCTVADYVTLA